MNTNPNVKRPRCAARSLTVTPLGMAALAATRLPQPLPNPCPGDYFGATLEVADGTRMMLAATAAQARYTFGTVA